MTSVTATEFASHVQHYLQHIADEPLIIRKTGRPMAVMLSYQEYQRSHCEEKVFNSQDARAALKHLQKAFSAIPASRDLVAELIEERRAEAAQNV